MCVFRNCCGTSAAAATVGGTRRRSGAVGALATTLLSKETLAAASKAAQAASGRGAGAVARPRGRMSTDDTSQDFLADLRDLQFQNAACHCTSKCTLLSCKCKGNCTRFCHGGPASMRHRDCQFERGSSSTATPAAAAAVATNTSAISTSTTGATIEKKCRCGQPITKTGKYWPPTCQACTISSDQADARATRMRSLFNEAQQRGRPKAVPTHIGVCVENLSSSGRRQGWYGHVWTLVAVTDDSGRLAVWQCSSCNKEFSLEEEVTGA